MDVQMVIPSDTPPTGGNRISSERLKLGLAKLGIEAAVMRANAGPLPSAPLYHAWNAARVGVWLVEQGVPPECLVVTWTGTDLWQDWVDDAPGIRRRLAAVRSQVVFTEDARQHLLQQAPEWASLVQVIPPSVDTDHFVPTGPASAASHPLILIAGGVRPVKRSAWSIELVEALRRATGMDVHLAVAGPVRDPAEETKVESLARTRRWVTLLGEVPKEHMAEWYRAADVVLNCSAVEGVSNALLEAMSSAALVAVSDIPGNRALVTDGVNGIVFASDREFVAKVGPYLAGVKPADPLRVRAREFILHRHSLIAEAEAYRALYERCSGFASRRQACVTD